MQSHAIKGITLQKATPINAVLSEAAQKDQAVARMPLELRFLLLRYLGEQGIATRGDGHRDGNCGAFNDETHSLSPEKKTINPSQ